MHWALIALIGGSIGFVGGMFGKGGSAIATPLLALVGVPPIIAVAAPLPATVPGTLVAYQRFRRSGFSDRRVIRWSIACGVPATVVGALVTRWVDGAILVAVTDVVVALLGLRVLLTRHAAECPESAAAAVALAAKHDTRVRLAAVAVTVGFLAGLLANSGGFLLVPLYLAVLSLPIRTALGCSLAVASLLAIPGTIVHAALGHIDWHIAIVFGMASIPLSSLGARTALRLDPARLERIYGAALFVLGTVLFVVR